MGNGRQNGNVSVSASTEALTANAAKMVDQEAEMAAVGAAILGAGTDVLPECRDILGDEGEEITEPDLRVLWQHTVALHEAAEPVDLVTLMARVRHTENGRTSQVEQVAIEAVSSVPSSRSGAFYAKIVADLGRRRKAATIALELINELAVNPEFDSAMAEKIASLRELVDTRKKISTLKGDAGELSRIIDEDVRLIPTGIGLIDGVIGGLRRGSLSVLAARTSVGKTSFGLTICRNMAAREDNKVRSLFVSAEMTKWELYFRMMSAVSDYATDDFVCEQVCKDDVKKLIRKCSLSDEGSGLHIADDIDSIDDVENRVELAAMRDGVTNVVVDYVQLLTTSGKYRDNRNMELTTISRRLKKLAKRCNVSILNLSQFNRNVDRREDPTPMLSDLRDSGAIEQDADIVMALYRDKRPEAGKVNWVCLKNRQGPVGRRIQLLFDASRMVVKEGPTING